MSTKIKGRFSKIVVGIDGSESSMDAADYATEMAKKDGAEVIALSVNRLPLSSYGLADPQDEVKQSEENEEMQEFRELLDKVSLNAKQSNV
jgi:nucleotide-binding universal stress UspA family protein